MADEIPRTPVPVPTYGQPQPQPQPQSSAPAPAIAQQRLPVAEIPVPAPAIAAEAQQTVAPTTESSNRDVAMVDIANADTALSPAPAALSTNAPSPAPAARTGTPLRTNGPENTSRAASQHPDPAFTMPDAAPAHGAPARQYLNSKVTAHLLEGMKQIVKDQPKDPLRVLGEFLIERSKELET
ncbi:hypothetical protein F4777DRAFT_541409 [Nemania sp. FL0916]|nr:hypothetical protein F4777DRAFT_541409 [Nemania sp. FL0916]